MAKHSQGKINILTCRVGYGLNIDSIFAEIFIFLSCHIACIDAAKGGQGQLEAL